MTRARAELLASRRAIAIGKLAAFDAECRRLADLVAEGVVPRADAIDALIEADTANNLTGTFGALVESILHDAFAFAGREVAA